jgi:hypothetical protein
VTYGALQIVNRIAHYNAVYQSESGSNEFYGPNSTLMSCFLPVLMFRCGKRLHDRWKSYYMPDVTAVQMKLDSFEKQHQDFKAQLDDTQNLMNSYKEIQSLIGAQAESFNATLKKFEEKCIKNIKQINQKIDGLSNNRDNDSTEEENL